MSDEPGFVCAVNGSRDGYQVPAALYESGQLDRFVTDFYAPDKPPSWLPGAMAGRRTALMPKSVTTNTLSCFIAQYGAARLGLPMHRIFPQTDKLLAANALRQAKLRKSHLYCYSSYLPRGERIPPGMRVVDFEYHPLPGLTIDLLRADAALYREVAWSFAREEEIEARQQVTESWKYADAVVCASRMTARSLEFAGCEAGRITVVPYGFISGKTARQRPEGGPAKFLFVGQGVQRKGLHHLLRVWREVDPARAELNLVCYAIDPGIAEMARQVGVTLLGRQDRSQLDALMQSSHVFIMPSLIEGFGLVYLEAMAAGCHVVGTENTGLPDLPLSLDARTLIKAGDLVGLGETIENLIVRHERSGFDAPAIAAEARSWTWADFRGRIAEHARSVVR